MVNCSFNPLHQIGTKVEVSGRKTALIITSLCSSHEFCPSLSFFLCIWEQSHDRRWQTVEKSALSSPSAHLICTRFVGISCQGGKIKHPGETDIWNGNKPLQTWSDNTLYHLVDFKHGEPFYSCSCKCWIRNIRREKKKAEMTFAGLVSNTAAWSCIPAQQIEPGGTSGPWKTKPSKSEITHWCTAGDPAAVPLLGFSSCMNGAGMETRSVTEHTSIHGYTSPHGSSYCLVFLQEPCTLPSSLSAGCH